MSFRSLLLFIIHIENFQTSIDYCVMLYVIGLGLGDEKDITVKGLEAVRSCERIFLEHYTSILCAPLEQLVRPLPAHTHGVPRRAASSLPFGSLGGLLRQENHPGRSRNGRKRLRRDHGGRRNRERGLPRCGRSVWVRTHAPLLRRLAHSHAHTFSCLTLGPRPTPTLCCAHASGTSLWRSSTMRAS